MRRNNVAFVGGMSFSSATKLPSIFWKPVLLVFNYKTLGSTGLVGRILDAMESPSSIDSRESSGKFLKKFPILSAPGSNNRYHRFLSPYTDCCLPRRANPTHPEGSTKSL